MRAQEKTNITLGDLVAAVTEEVKPLSDNKRRVNLLVSYILQDLFLSCRVQFRNKFIDRQSVRRQKWPAVALGMILFVAPGSSFAGAASDQLKQSVEKIQTILADIAKRGRQKRESAAAAQGHGP
jgi:uncharacterized membrane protein